MDLGFVVMIILIHGDDLVSSREKLLQEKQARDDNEIISLDGQDITLEDLITTLQTPSLLQIKKTLIVEDLLKKKPDKIKDKIISYLVKASEFNPIILWEGKEIGKGLIKKYFSKAKVYTFLIPRLLFKFLDGLAPSSRSNLLLFQQVLEKTDVELVFAMMIRQLRYLIIAKDLGSNGLDDLASWQANKFIRQSKYFSLEKLISEYRKLLAIDYNIKTGKTPYSLTQFLDIYLVNL